MGMPPRNVDDPFRRVIELAVDITARHMLDHVAASFADLHRSLIADFYARLAGQYIPKNTRLRRIERDEKLNAARCAGRTVADLAREFHLSESQIKRILEKRREPH